MAKIKEGSRVQYTEAWLLAVGILASKYRDRRGIVKRIQGAHRDIPPPRVLVEWDNGKTGLVIIHNLELTNHAESTPPQST